MTFALLIRLSSSDRAPVFSESRRAAFIPHRKVFLDTVSVEIILEVTFRVVVLSLDDSLFVVVLYAHSCIFVHN